MKPYRPKLYSSRDSGAYLFAGGGVCKVGRTVNFKNRSRHYRTNYPQLELIGWHPCSIPDARRIELEVSQRFIASRVAPTKEWFRADPDEALAVFEKVAKTEVRELPAYTPPKNARILTNKMVDKMCNLMNNLEYAIGLAETGGVRRAWEVRQEYYKEIEALRQYIADLRPGLSLEDAFFALKPSPVDFQELLRKSKYAMPPPGMVWRDDDDFFPEDQMS